MDEECLYECTWIDFQDTLLSENGKFRKSLYRMPLLFNNEGEILANTYISFFL